MTKESAALPAVKRFILANKTVLLLFAAGLLLLLWPAGGRDKTADQPVTEPYSEMESVASDRTLEEMEDTLAQILSSIDGAGQVRVMLSLEMQEETVLAVDQNGDRAETVVISTGSQKQEAVVTRINCAKYRGAVILAQGADSASVRLMITQAVSAITGLGSDSISVLKLK